jgi:hypothetical protein
VFTIAKHHSHWALGKNTAELHDRSGHLISGGTMWLRQLGSQIGMLNKVTINLDAFFLSIVLLTGTVPPNYPSTRGIYRDSSAFELPLEC